MKIQPATLNVLMNGMLVGILEKKKNGSLQFNYADEWLTTSGARPISLSLPLSERSFSGDVVYNFFDNLLPEDPQTRARIQAIFQANTNQPFDLLACIGRDCVGAIQFMSEMPSKFKQQIKCTPLSNKEIAIILRNYQNYPLGMKNLNEDFRISIAGIQEKSAFLYHQGRWNRPIGSTPTSHIFKLPIGFIQHQHIDLHDSCENEWLCAQIIQAFGVPVAQCDILHFEKVKVLAVERFDRALASNKKWIMRLPQEDICQALGISSNLKYQADGGPGIKDIMHLLLGSEYATADRDMFYRTQILFWLLAAIEGHAKNFSLFIKPEGKYHLTPLYDILSAHPLIEKKQLQLQKVKMAMSLKGKQHHYHWFRLQRRHFLDMAKSSNYSVERAESILNNTLEKVDTVIEEVSSKLPRYFPKYISQSIFKGMQFAKNRLSK